ncbi:MAG: hypothetical protein AB7F64_05655 [Gammaproteobacteria bacterium]
MAQAIPEVNSKDLIQPLSSDPINALPLSQRLVLRVINYSKELTENKFSAVEPATIKSPPVLS